MPLLVRFAASIGGVLQLQQQREKEEREAARAAEARMEAAPTPQQLEATRRRNAQHLERQAQRREANEVKKREEAARLEELQLQVFPSPPPTCPHTIWVELRCNKRGLCWLIFLLAH